MIHSSAMETQPLAYMSPEFLTSDEARPVRLMAEYLEPLRRFRKERIRDTVVFFGSARTRSREAAERHLAEVHGGQGAREPSVGRRRWRRRPGPSSGRGTTRTRARCRTG